jgi:hypothetical protein
METTKEEMRTPTNADIVRYLHLVGMNSSRSNVVIDEKYMFTSFEFRTNFGGTPLCFEAQFVDLKDFKVLCTTTKETFFKYPRAYALTSLLHDKCFSDVEAFAVACRNALGDDIQTEPLTGSIFVNGQCVDELLEVLEAKGKELRAEVKTMQEKIDMLAQIVTILCVKHTDCRGV